MEVLIMKYDINLKNLSDYALSLFKDEKAKQVIRDITIGKNPLVKPSVFLADTNHINIELGTDAVRSDYQLARKGLEAIAKRYNKNLPERLDKALSHARYYTGSYESIEYVLINQLMAGDLKFKADSKAGHAINEFMRRNQMNYNETDIKTILNGGNGTASYLDELKAKKEKYDDKTAWPAYQRRLYDNGWCVIYNVK